MMQKDERAASGVKRRIVTTGGTKRRVDQSNLQQQLGAAEVSRMQHTVDTPLGFVAIHRLGPDLKRDARHALKAARILR